MALNEQQKQTMIIVVFVGIVAVLGAAYYQFYIVNPKVTALAKTQKKIDGENKEAEERLEELEQWVAKKDQMKEQIALLDQATKRLPSSPDAPGFLESLVEVLRGTGIIQESVRATAPLSQPQYTEIPYSVGAYGRYHQLGQFLTLIEQNPDRFMRVKTLKVSNNLKRPSIHPIELSIATFTFNKKLPSDKAAPAPVETKGKPARAKR